MDTGSPGFIILIVGLCTAGWLINNWIRAKHGYALEDEWGGKTERADNGESKALQAENADLKKRLAALEKRTAALETIVTDEGYQTAQQIELLREQKRIAAEG